MYGLCKVCVCGGMCFVICGWCMCGFCNVCMCAFRNVWVRIGVDFVNPLTPNDHYNGRTTPLNSKSCILYIYSKNIDTEYFKRGMYSPFFLFKMQFVS